MTEQTNRTLTTAKPPVTHAKSCYSLRARTVGAGVEQSMLHEARLQHAISFGWESHQEMRC